MKDTFDQLSRATIGLHWIIAIGMIAMLGFGLYIEELPRSPDKGQLIGIHKSIGLLILLLALVRLIRRLQTPFPDARSIMPTWQDTLAKVAHLVLLIGTVLSLSQG